MTELVFGVSDFLSAINQTLEFAYPVVTVEGELADLRISKGRWLYFKLKDDSGSINCFGTVYMQPGPLEEGMVVRVTGAPRHHLQYGFSFNAQNIAVSGEGSLKKAQDLLLKKLTAEGLFDPVRKRPLPAIPERIGLITSRGSAAEADFIKILGDRWGGIEIIRRDSLVQGMDAPIMLVEAITQFNQLPELPEVLVIIRGGGSQDDLAAFSDERVVRAVSSSRIPTLIAIGHEVDVSLAELAADVHASTPTNAAQLLVPEREYMVGQLWGRISTLSEVLGAAFVQQRQLAQDNLEESLVRIEQLLSLESSRISQQAQLLSSYDPRQVLRRGYALVRQAGKLVASYKALKSGDAVEVELHDGYVEANITSIREV